MRKLLLLAIAPFFLIGCDENVDRTSTNMSIEGNPIAVIVVDSCEYVSGHFMLAHKGNCKFCAERKHTLLHDTIYVFKRDTVYIYKKVKL